MPAASPLQRLVRSVTAIVDRGMHQPAVRRFVEEEPVDLIVPALRELMTDLDKEGYRETYRAVVQCVVNQRTLSYAVVEELYRVALATQCEPVRYLLLRAPAQRLALPEEVRPDPDTKELALGVRKSMARSLDRDVLTRLVLDPTVSVIEILLQNPKIIEADVVRMAARRPSLTGVLELVADHPKWALRYAVQQSLVQNPYSPTSVAAALVPYLKGADLAEVANDFALHEAVRRCARTIVDWRRERRGGVVEPPSEADVGAQDR